MGLFTKKLLGDGDLLFQLFAEGQAEAVAMVTRRRSEGVRDEEIINFWNMSERSRNATFSTDQASRIALYLAQQDSAMDEDDAADAVFKSQPRWGDPYDPEQLDRGDDRELYAELHDRVNRYVIRQHLIGRSEYQTRLSHATSFNAFIRGEMRAGRL